MGTETFNESILYQKQLVEKMGPLRGDGNPSACDMCEDNVYGREDGSPSWGRKQGFTPIFEKMLDCREDGSPSWGRKRLLMGV